MFHEAREPPEAELFGSVVGMKFALFKTPRVFTPYYNAWNQDVYDRQAPFEECPLDVMASSTSGAPVAITETHLIGLTKLAAGVRFAWDGRVFTAEAPEGGLIVIEGTGDAAWEAYHRALNLPPPPQAPFGRVPEYCTWVEQVWLAGQEGKRPNEVLTNEFTRNYLDAVCNYRWPKGRFTIDEGWCPRHGEGGFGDWAPREEIDLPGLASEILSAGFIPGLWLAPALISLNSRLAEKRPNEVLTNEFTRNYLDAVCNYRWPKGRFTIDEGWCPRHGEGGFGDWAPREEIDLPGLASEILSAGFIPGLWLAPALISLNSRLAEKRPELLGEPFEIEAESGWSGFAFLRPGNAARDYLAGVFQQGWDWGFRKFKLDIFYGSKRLMIEIHRLCWEAAQLLPGPVELEGHIPDPFASQFVHVVRLNDVLITPEDFKWRSVARSHFHVCCQSAPGHVLNLDHLGGNRPSLTEEQWIEHAEIMREQLACGYPAVSLLPFHVGKGAEKSLARLLADIKTH